MRLLRLDQDDAAGGGALAGAAAEKVLHAPVGDADQPFVMPVQVIGMAGKAGTDSLDAARGIAHQCQPVGERGHGRGAG
jgi:hypothetical protein